MTELQPELLPELLLQKINKHLLTSQIRKNEFKNVEIS